MRIETYLPMFPGFYGTIFEGDNEDDEISDINSQRKDKGMPEITYEDCEWNYPEYHVTVSEEVTESIQNKLKEVLECRIIFHYQKLVSPKEYNFGNDAVDIEVFMNNLAKLTYLGFRNA